MSEHKSSGVYKKFIVTRTDGTHRKGKKHEGCTYFVLDTVHDPFAEVALIAYANACERDYPGLAKDIRRQIPPVLPTCGAV
jgi:hypothetical protein